MGKPIIFFWQIFVLAVGNLQQACETATTYLMFKPDDETMQNNLQFYQNDDRLEKDASCQPRKVSVATQIS